MRNSLLVTIGIFIATVVLINLFTKAPQFNSLEEKAAFEEAANQPNLAEQTLLQMLQKDSLNMDLHFEYISTHFSIPEKKKVGKNSYEYRDDNTIRNYYEFYAEQNDHRLADIGNYGKGLIAVQFDNYHVAIAEFKRVKNKELKYLNNSLGNAYNHTDSANLAEAYFRREIALQGNLQGAYSNLVSWLFERGQTDEIREIMKNKSTSDYVPSHIERAIYFLDVAPWSYSLATVKRVFSNFNLWGILAAFLIMGSWIMYLRKIDIFDVERWRNIILVVGLGMFFCFFTYPLSDFNNLVLGFQLNGNILNDFLYCVFGIGAIEELVKILPLLFILRFTKIINEPFDYIVYASLSALGFAFIENILYFSEHNLFIIHGRALTAVVSHMFDSSIIAYGLILNKYKRQWNPVLNFLAFFLLAATAHGFYDFWLINDAASTFSIITILFLLASMYIWNSFKNNALNQSNFYDKDVSINGEKLKDYLLYSLSAVLLFEYIALAFKFSSSVANTALVSSLTSGTYLIFFLSSKLSQFRLVKGEWAPIQYWSSARGKTMNYEGMLDKEVKISALTNNDLLHVILPNTGKVIQRFSVSGEEDWYLVQLNKSFAHPAYLPDKVLIRTKDKEEIMETGNGQVLAFYVLPAGTDLQRKELLRTEFKFCGWAILA